MINKSDSYLQPRFSIVLGSIYPYIKDKDQLYNILTKLCQSRERNVRVYANHSLGRICIYKATESSTIEEFKNELKKALDFFDKASNDSPQKLGTRLIFVIHSTNLSSI